MAEFYGNLSEEMLNFSGPVLLNMMAKCYGYSWLNFNVNHNLNSSG